MEKFPEADQLIQPLDTGTNNSWTPGHCSPTTTCTENHAFRPTRLESGINHRVRDHGDHGWADLLGDSTRLAVDRTVGGDSRCGATGRDCKCSGRRTDPVVVLDARPSSHVRRGQRDRRSAQPGQPWVPHADGVPGTRRAGDDVPVLYRSGCVRSSRFIRAATTAMNAATMGMHPATAKMVSADTTSDKAPVTAVDTGTRAKVTNTSTLATRPSFSRGTRRCSKVARMTNAVP